MGFRLGPPTSAGSLIGLKRGGAWLGGLDLAWYRLVMKVLLGWRFRAASIAVASLAVATACESEVELVDQQLMVGVAESEAQATSIALSLEDGHVVAYVCGEQASLESNTGWLEGDLLADGSFELSANGLHLRGTVNGDEAEGTLHNRAGVVLAWHADGAQGDLLSGLFVAAGAGCRTGVIVHSGEPGQAPSLRGSACREDGTRTQVTPVHPEAISKLGFVVSFQDGASEKLAIVNRLQP